jgi:hypothetical protein
MQGSADLLHARGHEVLLEEDVLAHDLLDALIQPADRPAQQLLAQLGLDPLLPFPHLGCPPRPRQDLLLRHARLPLVHGPGTPRGAGTARGAPGSILTVLGCKRKQGRVLGLGALPHERIECLAAAHDRRHLPKHPVQVPRLDAPALRMRPAQHSVSTR